MQPVSFAPVPYFQYYGHAPLPNNSMMMIHINDNCYTVNPDQCMVRGYTVNPDHPDQCMVRGYTVNPDHPDQCMVRGYTVNPDQWSGVTR